MSQNQEDRDSGQSVGWAWLAALINPFFLFQALSEVVISWLFTRPWKRLCLFLPAIAVVVAAMVLIGYGSLMGRNTLTERYATLADEELTRVKNENVAEEDKDASEEKLMEDVQTSAYSEMLYRRLMQLDDQNARTRFMVARQLERSGRVTQARQLMQEIAPVGERGFAPAHTWLAIDMLQRKTRGTEGATKSFSKEEQSVLMAHLREAVSWEGTGSALLAIYADLLLREGKQQEALDVMSKAAQKNPRMRGNLALMAKGRNKKLADESSVVAMKSLQDSIAAGKGTPDMYLELVALKLAAEEYKTALETARTGLTTLARDVDPSPALAAQLDRLKLLSSEALRLMYRQSIRKTDKGVELNLGLLDAAMKEYPANPNLAVEIAMLTDMGVEAPPALKALMHEQLASGQSTALAHLLLANQELKAGNLEKAIPHLEISLKQAPNHPVTLNNLALALALTDNEQIERAEELIAKAIELNPRNAEFYDSQGEIRLTAGKPLDAVASLEKAIGLDPSRRHTHELMVKAYRAAGSEEMAAVHEKFLTSAKEDGKGKQQEAAPDASEETQSPSP